MEHESFEDEETAGILNQSFVSIKVDREERPDVDSVYMSACMGLTGQGGWPLTLLLTPDQRPFYAATYLPKRGYGGHMGLDDLLIKVAALWREDRALLLESAERVTEYLNNLAQTDVDKTEPSDDILHHATDTLRRGFDSVYGGFGGAPKFPTPHNLLFLMRYSEVFSDDEALKMAETTLHGMFRGGMFDHIGDGFSRYSTDAKWLVPHFEKMLYDNALLMFTYTCAYEKTRNDFYLRIAERTAGYVLRELSHPDGGFLCGQDADSEGVEGKYYVFTPDEIGDVLSPQAAKRFCSWFDITKSGNFEGKSIPNLLRNNHYAQDDDEIRALCDRVYEYRRSRTHLHKDDKILTSWNALMIAALAKVYRVTGNRSYLLAAQLAQEFIERSLTDKDGRLKVRWRDGEAAGQGTLDDYAFYAWALLEMYDTEYKVQYLERACAVSEMMMTHFIDEQNGGLYMSADDAQALISRPKELYDGAIPSGNSVAAYVWERLSLLSANPVWRRQSEQQMRFIAASTADYPAGYCFAMLALMHYLHKPHTLVCATRDMAVTGQIARFLQEKGLNDTAVLIITPENKEQLARLAPFTSDYPLPEHGARYYLCRDGVCLTPADSLDALQII